MFLFDEARVPVTKKEVLSKITELQIFERYCSNFKAIDKDFLSEFYDDSRPSCRIFYRGDGTLAYKDFGSGEYYTCFDYVKRKFFCNYYEALNIVANDFNISKIDIKVKPKSLVLNDIAVEVPTNKSKIDIVEQPFTLVDFDYWNQYKIPLSLLSEYNVFSCSHVFLYKNDKVVTFLYSKQNPIYAYRFTYEGEYYYKIYKPMETNKKYKWLFSGSKFCVEGEDQLPLFGDILILTKSLKDCMCYNLLGLPAISLQGEANRIEQGMLDRVLKRFKRVIVNYDNDEEGRRGSQRIMQQMGFKSFFIDEPYKDLADYVEGEGIDKAKDMIYNKLNEIKDIL